MKKLIYTGNQIIVLGMTILPNIQHTESYEHVVYNKNDENKESEYINNIFSNFNNNSEEISNIYDNLNNYINSMDEVEKNRLPRHISCPRSWLARQMGSRK